MISRVLHSVGQPNLDQTNQLFVITSDLLSALSRVSVNVSGLYHSDIPPISAAHSEMDTNNLCTLYGVQYYN